MICCCITAKVTTEAIAGEGMIVTAGGLDMHVPWHQPGGWNKDDWRERFMSSHGRWGPLDLPTANWWCHCFRAHDYVWWRSAALLHFGLCWHIRWKSSCRLLVCRSTMCNTRRSGSLSHEFCVLASCEFGRQFICCMYICTCTGYWDTRYTMYDMWYAIYTLFGQSLVVPTRHWLNTFQSWNCRTSNPLCG